MNQGALGPNLLLVKKLGEGSFSEVYEVHNKKNNDIYAVKSIKQSYKTLEEIKKIPEISTLTALKGNPFIVKMVDVLYDFERHLLAIVFEKLDINLYEFMCEVGCPLPEELALLITYQILKGLHALHQLNLFHRDIKPENCMINRNTFEVKIVDFGSVRHVEATGPYTEYVSTRWYRAPECIMTSGSYSKEIDVWAVGCMLYELLRNTPMFPGKNEVDQINMINEVIGTPSADVLKMFKQNPNNQIDFDFPPRKKQDLKNLLPDISNSTVDLLDKLLIYNPLDRIRVETALEHPAFTKMLQADQLWTKMGQRCPFSLFYINGPILIPKLRTVLTPKAVKEPQKGEDVKHVKILNARKQAAQRIRVYNKLHPKVSARPSYMPQSFKPTLVMPNLKKNTAVALPAISVNSLH